MCELQSKELEFKSKIIVTVIELQWHEGRNHEEETKHRSNQKHANRMTSLVDYLAKAWVGA